MNFIFFLNVITSYLTERVYKDIFLQKPKHYKIQHMLCLYCTVLPAKSDSDFVFCLQSYQGLIIDISLVY